jgi:aspartyl-tRNA synthetase
MSFVDEEDILTMVEKLFAYAFKEVLGKELKIPFPRISHKEAMQKYKSDKPDIGGDDEFRFLWVVDFPLFEYNDDEKRWQSCHHPFTGVNPEDASLLDGKDLGGIRSRSYDLVLNGEEIGSGSVRIHQQDLQKKIFSILGISAEEAEAKFGFLLKAFQYGPPPHAGVAFGLDRLYAIISGSESIREVIAFPKTQKGASPLTHAPSKVSDEQLEELNLKLVEVKEEDE